MPIAGGMSVNNLHQTKKCVLVYRSRTAGNADEWTATNFSTVSSIQHDDRRGAFTRLFCLFFETHCSTLLVY